MGLVVAGGAAWVSGLLAACGGQGETTKPAAPRQAPSTPVAGATPAGAGAPRKGGTLKVALDSDIIGIDPHGPSAGVDRNVYTSIYNGLVAPDRDLNIVPDLAESWTTPDDRTYVFKLRNGMKFHDGTDCDAEAVKKNFDWILDPANASPRRPELSDVQGVDVVDPLTVRITLRNPFAPFLAIISDRAGYVVSPTARQKFGKDYPRNPVGTGPFQFVEWVKDDHVSFKRFEDYFEKDVPLIDQVVYRPIPDLSVAVTELKTGNVDFLYRVDPKDVEDIKATNNLAILEGPGVGFQGLWLNTARGPLTTRALREAVSLAVDREALLSAAYFGVGQIAQGPIPPSSWAFEPGTPYVKREVAEAKARLAEGGQPSGFSMVLKAQSNSPLQEKITQLVQAQLKEIGIDVQIQTMEFGALLKAGEQNDFDALSLGWSGRIDPDGNIQPIFHSNGAFNYGKYSNPEIDELIARGRQVADRAERKRIYQELQTKLNDDVAYVFTYFPPTLFAAGATVKGFQVTPDGLMRFKATWVDRA
jgi:peptide/nickel transport system substrate-binding protein